MPYLRVIPRCGGGRTIDKVGDGVDWARVGHGVGSIATQMAVRDGATVIAEVDVAPHIELDADVIAVSGVISSYSSSAERPTLPYWKLGFADTTLRLLGS